MGRLLAVVFLGPLSAVGASPVCGAAAGECESPEDSSLLQLPARREGAHSAVETAWSPSKGSGWANLFTTSTPPPGTGLVDELYTYGAPGTCVVPLADHAHGGTFPGVRAYTEDIFGVARESKQVDAAAIFDNLKHSRTATLDLHWNEPSYFVPGKGRPEWPLAGGAVYAHWPLHTETIYRDRLDAVTLKDGEVPADHPEIARSRFFAQLAWKAYDTTDNTRATLAKDYPGWSLVADEVLINGVGADDEDPVRLYQDGKTLECALVFTGTNHASEFVTSTKTQEASFCGFMGVHQGYRDEVWHLTANLWPLLRPKLSQCSKVSVIGHSLGGSVAEIFAACANSGNMNDPDYQQQAWVKGTPTRMPATSGERHVVRNTLL